VTDLGGGIYVSRVDSDEFEPDDEVGGFTHMLFEDGETMAGMWKPSIRSKSSKVLWRCWMPPGTRR